ncbi:NEW3 domain-containing protein [Actinocatenispora rupis]|uniref:glycoside hydrolase family 38 N-terminal domain-containing protein n=1 Tax=Actinocatenispora rupis TaxID=519421 RepID=UPI0019423FF2|nr:NEW3 domain-containing protein [Actinocatenispora rupis]
MPTVISSVESTDLFVGTEEDPRQVVRVRLAEPAGTGILAVTGPGVTTPDPVPLAGDTTVEVGVRTEAAVGSSVAVTVTVDGVAAPGGTGVLTVAEPGWTMVMVNHFHYDPVWWNTQAAYTSEWQRPDLTDQNHRGMPGFALVRAHLAQARRDPDYTFVLAELDYLKPFWDAYPEHRSELRALLAEGRLELMGGTYNEPNSNLTAAETTARNLVYGIGFQRGVLGGEPATAWQLDVFGHDPQFPGMVADAGLTSSSWARGPFHQWGPMLDMWNAEPGDATVMQFPAEFEWISPSGRGVLTAYMANHYSAGWWMDSAPTLDEAVAQTYRLYQGLKPVAAGKSILLPVGTDYTPPNRWVTEIHRHWRDRYVWPRFVSGLPREFFDLVRRDLAEQGRTATPQSRDMNPVYTGKDVSYIDTKQAHRAGEQAAMEAEKFATLASLYGAGYPHEALDSAWRQLAYGAHHDAVTGSESDQVYLDLMTGWREALERAGDVRDAAQEYLTGLVDSTAGDGVLAVTVHNGQSFARTDVVTVRVELPAPGVTGLVAADGDSVRPVAVEAAEEYPEGGLRAAVVSFVAVDVPGIGYRTVHLVPAEVDGRWVPVDGVTATSDRFTVRADPARGGGLASVVERATGRELVAAGEVANELVVYDEYAEHPRFKEGPWHLVPSGGRTYARDTAATVTAERGPLGERLVVRGEVGPVRYTQYVTVLDGVDRVDVRTRVDEFTGSDKLVRVRFPSPVPGALPVSEVGDAVIGRGFGLIDVDSAEHPWTLDNPAYTWFGLSAAARVSVSTSDGTGRRAIGIAEVVCPDAFDQGRVRPLVVALVGQGVTATTSRAGGSRYGLLDVDSNLPDVRVLVGGPERNGYAARVLAEAGEAYAEEWTRQLAETGRARVWVPAARPLAEVWVPGADLRDPEALDCLLVDGVDDAALDAELAAVVADLADADIAVAQRVPHGVASYEDRTVGLLNRGIPGFAVTSDGALHLSLLRSCTGWPSGVWLDPPKRTAPDGSAFQLQHWTHELEYAFVAGDGDWRRAGMVEAGAGFTNPLRGVVAPPHPGPLPASAALVEVSDGFVLTTLKPTGNPIAVGSAARPSVRDGVTVRGYDAYGRGGEVRIGLVTPVVAARTADLLERPGDPLPVRGGTATLHSGPSDVVTAVLDVDATGLAAAPASPLGPTTDPVQPLFSRYWLHNSGPAPLGYQPVSVHVEPTRAAVDGGVPVSLRVVVSSDVVDADRAGLATVAVPAGWTASATTLPYELGPGGHVEYTVTVTPPAEPEPGRYAVRVGITDAGQRYEDVALLTAGPVEEPEPPADPVAAQAIQGGDSGVTLELTSTGATVEPGGTTTVEAVLHNANRTDADVAVWALSPYETWGMVGPRVQGVTVPAGGSAPVTVTVTAPLDAAPRTAWVLLKAASAGAVRYSPAVPLIVGTGR